jgi:hypothetical protein
MPFPVVGQSGLPTEPIALRAEPLPFTPREFYIADLIDEREDRSAVVYLLPSPNSPSAATRPLDLQGGALTAIRAFVQRSLPRNTALRPVVIHLQECRVTESPATNGSVEGQVMLRMAFDYQREGEVVHLVDYRGGARYQRPVGQLAAIEPALRKSLASALQYLNTWMERQAGSSEKLARQLQVHFTDYTRNPSFTPHIDRWPGTISATNPGPAAMLPRCFPVFPTKATAGWRKA